jgi:CRISPR-associated endonuclease/helicase Cas3
MQPVMQEAKSEEPLRPALTRALVDAWSMTSLAEHPGRPEVEPWLRGWVDSKPQTRVLWRRLLPVREHDDAALRRKTLDEFFQNAPPHLGEILETLTEDVVEKVMRRAKARQTAQKREAAREDRPVKLPPLAAVTLSPRGEVEQVFTLADLARLPSRQLFAILVGRTVVLDAELGGLSTDGLLDANTDTPPLTLDAEDDSWGADLLVAAGFRLRRDRANAGRDADWRVEWRWRLDPDDDTEDGDEIRVEVLRRAAATSGDAAIAKRAQVLAEHHAWAAHQAARIADRVGLREPYRKMLIAAAQAHDAGKARDLWQRAMGAPRDGKIYAKTVGGGIPALLNGYRHEFGSLRDTQTANCLRDLPEEARELGLHLIASHHGFARPVIAAIDPEAPPSTCAELAQEAALRFAELQAQWGSWGLAWWEALLRAADWAASRQLNERGDAM